MYYDLSEVGKNLRNFKRHLYSATFGQHCHFMHTPLLPMPSSMIKLLKLALTVAKYDGSTSHAQLENYTATQTL